MIKSDFENYVPYLGRSNYLTRELLALVNHAELYPSTAAQLMALFDLDVPKVRGRLEAAAQRAPGAVVPVSSVTTVPTGSIEMAGGETRQIVTTVLPANATDKTVTYTTNDASVATVSATGLITAGSPSIMPAACMIFAESGGQTAEIIIQVKNP
ncbi:hypothetical protein IVIADoCa7_2 [Xanthomonas phage vB_Xar_IVIA-DoCa7]|uniref:BIG2 domain-containing protein n=1 Tax=Xanthomonas phage vB_Xar_IVIA-DoCa7 TaxID=2975534 RepID=A0A9X9NYH8_9CAUD|nr:hypothetical protein IVIADoCa7_2 [Xanthomonas phage vB_Xar_IVIA-DoCa7]